MPGRLVVVITGLMLIRPLLMTALRIGYEVTVLPAVAKVDDEPNQEPNDKPHPRPLIEGSHHRKANHDAQYGDERHQWGPVGPRNIRLRFPHHHDPGAYDDKRQQRSDAGHIAQTRERHE